MYDIYIRNDNTVIVTGGNRIVQGSSMVDTVRVLVPKAYNETITDMSEFSCMMEYILPCSKKYLVDVLVEDVPNSETVDDIYENYVVIIVNILQIVVQREGVALSTEVKELIVGMTIHKQVRDIRQALTIGNILDDAIANEGVLGGLVLLVVLDVLIGKIAAYVEGSAI